MLGQHLHRGLIVHGRVQRRAQRIHELLERVLTLRIFQQLFNQTDVTPGDRCDVLGPVVPIQGRTDLLDDAAEDALLPIRGKKRELSLDFLSERIGAGP